MKSFTKQDRIDNNLPENISDYDMLKYLRLQERILQFASEGIRPCEADILDSFNIINRYYLKGSTL